ncbi:hypothetical protein HBA54_04235 [Pelagibius litoralis]|uniref:Uncharacterized protein n=1 Tax=Pelagibius litoralis TaxID=374515 RepID=A0A967EUW2_9PROT|nr:hypothetical protein [Pelagibius litoralis]NIA67791.1 hypothetical protein [Pelagibius litoralis]
MTLFSSVLQGLGLSQREAAAFLEVRPDTVKSWGAGRNAVPDGIWSKLRELADQQTEAAQKAFDLWQDQGEPQEVEFYIAANDDEAQKKGWPCVGAQMAVARRLFEYLPDNVEILLSTRQ